MKSLRQGDVLKRTPGLLDILREVHPHYADEKYTHFQVLTQSCDLVRRDGASCKSRYISLAAVRSVDVVIQRAIEKYERKIVFQDKLYCSEQHKSQLKDVINKLLNNNDTNHFFLKADPEAGIALDSCTLLHLSISIQADLHFETCLAAKLVELKENFRAKLGWLVGNLYSRVGTEDYVPSAIPDKSSYDAFVNDMIGRYVAWVPQDDFSSFRSNTKNANSLTEITERVSQQREKKRDAGLEQLLGAITNKINVSSDDKAALRNILAAHPIVMKGLTK
ncbi:hypothetical protein KDW65_25140 [Burkholderia cenocepacia]|uniref:hypothetical protein n=1 Tax=Burkholderia cenocepacia TaxID=95486 RepID=UPI001B96CCCA|nr:hypothetical protein [Burkholderia cenocepacia]MBR8399921.1 hypothetical protein [Burkholderia cenocepacia]